MKYKGYIKLPCEVEANNELEAKEKIADKLSDACFCTFIREDVELESDNVDGNALLKKENNVWT